MCVHVLVVPGCNFINPIFIVLHFNNLTRLVADVKMVHVFSTQDHTYKPTNIKAAEQEKRTKYKMYVTAGLDFAPAVVNTFGQLGPDLLRIGWKCAAKAAQRDLPNIVLDLLQYDRQLQHLQASNQLQIKYVY